MAHYYKLLEYNSYQMEITLEGEPQGEESFFFEPIPNKILEDKEIKEILTKWYKYHNVGDSSKL